MSEATVTANHALVAGLDVGSRSIELVLLEDGQVVHRAKLPTTFDPLAQCRRLLEGLPPARIVATGYGRKLLVENLKHPGSRPSPRFRPMPWGRTISFPGGPHRPGHRRPGHQGHRPGGRRQGGQV